MRKASLSRLKAAGSLAGQEAARPERDHGAG